MSELLKGGQYKYHHMTTFSAGQDFVENRSYLFTFYLNRYELRYCRVSCSDTCIQQEKGESGTWYMEQ